MVNTSGLSEADFRAANPTTRAATVLGPDAAGIPALLDSVLDPARDPLAGERTRLKEYLLGPSEPPSQVRFQQAVRALCAAADARRERQARLAGGGTELPIPRSTDRATSR